MRCASETSRNRAPSPSKLQGRPALHDLDAGLVVPVQQLVRDLADGRLVGELERVGPEPLHADHRHQLVGQDSPGGRAGLEVLQFADARSSTPPSYPLDWTPAQSARQDGASSTCKPTPANHARTVMRRMDRVWVAHERRHSRPAGPIVGKGIVTAVDANRQRLRRSPAGARRGGDRAGNLRCSSVSRVYAIAGEAFPTVRRLLLRCTESSPMLSSLPAEGGPDLRAAPARCPTRPSTTTSAKSRERICHLCHRLVPAFPDGYEAWRSRGCCSPWP